jgi:hypothetical protein
MKKIIITIVCVMTVLFLGYQFLKFASRISGSHHDAEYYQLQMNKDGLITAINNFIGIGA